MSKRMTSTSRKRSFRSWWAAAPLGAALLAGCNAAPTETDEAASAEPSGGGLSFASEHDALEWIARRADELDLGTTAIERNEAGRVTKVSGVSIGSPAAIAEKKARLMGELGGVDRTVEIAGQRIVLEDPEPQVKLATAHCSGDLCTNDESFKSDYFFYRELGSRTSVTSGGFVTQHQTIYGQGAYECVDYPGPLPVTCTGYCNYASPNCPSGFTLESSAGYPSCTRTCVGQVRNVTLAISIMGFDHVDASGILVQSIPEQSGTTHDSSLEVKYWEYTAGVTDTLISEADGLCGTHSTTGPNGVAVNAKSHWGTVPSSCQ
jgi:hypothetical protein